jgi:hypothetical protein
MVVLLSHGRDQGEKALCEQGEFAYCHRHNARCQAGALFIAGKLEPAPHQGE